MLQDSLAVLTIMGLISFLGASSTTRALGAAQSAREQAEVAATELDHANAVLEAPLVGNLDAVRAQRLIGDVLDQIEQCRARAIILDVSGVAVVDTQRAQVLLRTAEATRLLGAWTILVGIRPEVAQTLVSLGADLSSLHTAATLREGLATLSRVKS